jgi:uncharacterized integral membrane protein
MKYLYALAILLMALFLAAFIQQNGQDVVLKYFYWRTVPLPLSLFIILAFAGGYALAVVVGLYSGIRHRVRTASAQKEARKLRDELGSLKEKNQSDLPKNPIKDTGDGLETAGGADKRRRDTTVISVDGAGVKDDGGEKKGER